MKTAAGASSTKKRERLSDSLSKNKEVAFPQLYMQLCSSRRQQSEPKLVVSVRKVDNRVGAHPAKIHQLHKKNVLRYLKNASEVEAAGESVLYYMSFNNITLTF